MEVRTLSFGGAKIRLASSAYHLPSGKLGDRLADDAHRLAHLLAADEVAVVAVALGADRDVEVVLLVAAVRLVLAQVERHAARPQVRAREAVGDRVLLGDDADAGGPVGEDLVPGQEVQDLLEERQELVAEGEDAARSSPGGRRGRPRRCGCSWS
jgi:hypothetical protein